MSTSMDNFHGFHSLYPTHWRLSLPFDDTGHCLSQKCKFLWVVRSNTAALPFLWEIHCWVIREKWSSPALLWFLQRSESNMRATRKPRETRSLVQNFGFCLYLTVKEKGVCWCVLCSLNCFVWSVFRIPFSAFRNTALSKACLQFAWPCQVTQSSFFAEIESRDRRRRKLTSIPLLFFSLIVSSCLLRNSVRFTTLQMKNARSWRRFTWGLNVLRI